MEARYERMHRNREDRLARIMEHRIVNRQNARVKFIPPPTPAKLMPLHKPHRRRNRRVLVHGLVYFSRMFAEMMNGDGWEFRFYPDSGLRNLAAMALELRA